MGVGTGKAVVIESIGVASVQGVGNEMTLVPRMPARLVSAPLSQFKDRLVGLVPAFDEGRLSVRRKDVKLMGRASRLAVAASRAALDGFGEGLSLKRDDVGLFLGLGMSGGETRDLAAMLDVSITPSGEIDHGALGREGLSRLQPLLSFHVLPNMPLCHVSIELALRGPHLAFFAEQAEGILAFEHAANALRRDKAEAALCGGVDAPVNTLSLALATPSARLAEGAAMALLRLCDRPAVGALVWRGVVMPAATPIDACHALGVEFPGVWVTVGCEPSGKLPRDVSVFVLEDMVGETRAASGPLAVALAVRLFKAGERSVGILARCLGGDAVAVVEAVGRESEGAATA